MESQTLIRRLVLASRATLIDLSLTHIHTVTASVRSRDRTAASLSQVHNTQLYFTTNVVLVAKKTYIIKHKLNKLNK